MAVSVGQEVLLIGGEIQNSGTAKDSVESYNVITNTWRALSPLQIGRHGGAAAVINNKVHVVSGSEGRGGGPESAVHEVLDVQF